MLIYQILYFSLFLTSNIGRWSPTLLYDYDLTSEIWSHKSKYNY